MQTVYFFDATADAGTDFSWRVEKPIIILGILQSLSFLSPAADCQIGMYMGTKTLSATVATTDEENGILAALLSMVDFETAAGFVSNSNCNLYLPMHYHMDAGESLHRILIFHAGSPTSVRAIRIVQFENVRP